MKASSASTEYASDSGDGDGGRPWGGGAIIERAIIRDRIAAVNPCPKIHARGA
ncbi:MAG TPA: hypothetical protein VMU50_20150 [Polyangia bacterium]|nr:hypothetical protein [Polyangia bacterium]